MSETAVDQRGRMYREKRQMEASDTADFLRRQKTANVGTVDGNGWPYVVPLVYIYEGGDLLYLHTGDHQGQFLTNVQANPRICVEVSSIGDLHPGKSYACNSALVYTSVITYGAVRILHGPEARDQKTWFLDRLLEKYGQPEWTFEPGYPMIDRIILYEMKMEIVTGKHSSGLYH
jgi:nitroimidazol reductase NimA-like FMN-containing flavoprotein (pyridoxamine 5'-phosphate oxidase superfamily)